MADYGIYDEDDKYFVLREYWPNNDMSAYILCTEPRDRNFKSFRAYSKMEPYHGLCFQKKNRFRISVAVT